MNLDYSQIKQIDEIDDWDDKVLAAAVMYAEAGFYVIPIRRNQKAIPKKEENLGYTKSSRNPKTVAEWYKGKYRGWNIGLACGAKDGIFVLDVDNGKKNGFPAYEAMVEDHGEFDTMVQRTPSGGLHVVFHWFENGRSSTSAIATGLDTRGGDGTCRSHIVAWPSKIDGKHYEWERVGGVSDAPEWLADLLGVPWERTETQGRGSEEVGEDQLERTYTRREMWNMLSYIDPDELEYEEWLKVGQAIHTQHPDEGGLELWDRWSQKGERYEEGECDLRWKGFKPYGPVRIGTLVHFAQRGGYVAKPNVTELEQTRDSSEYEQLIEEMNAEWGIAVVGGKIRVIGRMLNANPERDLVMLSLDDFKNLNMNKKIAITDGAGKIKPVPKCQIWLADEGRKEFTGGVEFRPDKPTEFDSPTGLTYNMWRGWTMEPAKGDWSCLRRHIEEVICSGNEEYYTWLLDWMADLYQDPADPKGCAVVLKGLEGSGKGTLFEAMGRTIGRHYKHLTQDKHLTGSFNGHLQDALLVFADEVVYGGEKKSAGALKALVTEPKLMVERKGLDAYSYDNYARIGIASNEDWFIPAGPQSRRWFVLETSSERTKDRKWFDAIYKEMDNGGIEAMMYDLLRREITTDLKRAPETALLRDQQERYVASISDTFKGWWADCLERGTIDVMDEADEDGEIGVASWPRLVDKTALYDVYEDWCNTKRYERRQIKTKPEFYRLMERYGAKSVRPSIKKGPRRRMFDLGELQYHCDIFTKTTGQTVGE